MKLPACGNPLQVAMAEEIPWRAAEADAPFGARQPGGVRRLEPKAVP